jgi:hypothetical protein
MASKLFFYYYYFFYYSFNLFLYGGRGIVCLFITVILCTFENHKRLFHFVVSKKKLSISQRANHGSPLCSRDVKRLVFCESTCRRHKSKNRSISSLFFGPRLQQLQSSKDLRIPLRQRPSWPTRPISKVAIRSTPIMHFFYEVKLI